MTLRFDIKNSALTRGLASMVSAAAAGQALVFFAAPVLARLFAPTDFGNAANYGAWVSILGLLSNLRYEQAIFVAAGRAEMNRVIALALFFSGVSIVAYGLAAAALYVAGPTTGYLGSLREILPFIPGAVAAIVVLSLLTHFHARRGGYVLLARMALVEAVITVGLQLTLGGAHVHNGLVIGAFVGTVATTAIFLAVHLRSHSIRHVTREAAPLTLASTARTHWRFPRYLLGADVIALLSLRFIPVALTAVFGASVAGLYAVAARAIRTPLIAISDSVLAILRKPSIEAHTHGTGLMPLFRRTLAGLSVVAVVPFGLLVVYGPSIFGAVFGERWVDAGRIAQILAPGMMLEFIALPLMALLLVSSHQRATFLLQLANLSMLGLAIIAGAVINQSFLTTCGLISIAMATSGALIITVAYTVSRRSMPGPAAAMPRAAGRTNLEHPRVSAGV